MRKAFALGVLAAVVGAAIAAALVIGSGVVDVAATRTRGGVDRILAYASTRSIAHHARSEKNPLARDPAAARKGLEHYRDDCVACHGGPGVHPAEFAGGLHPPPPDLASRQVQSFTDGMLYEAIAGGIGSTGMPAFGRTHSPDEIWTIVAFLRHLPELTPEEKKELGQAQGAGGTATAAPPSHPAPPGHGEAAASAAAGGPGQHVHQVSISSFKFVPGALEVSPGDVVEWKNADFVAHTATADDRTFDTGQIEGGEAKRLVVRKKGRFPYFCSDHPSMKATLVVR